MLLELKNIKAAYGNIKALKGINLAVPEGKIVTLIGANGAGKSTTMKTIMGVMKPIAGDVLFKGESIAGKKTYHRNDKKEIAEDMAQVFERFPRLFERQSQFAGTLSGGEQQMLAIGRAMMARPQVMLLDEPSMGLAPLVVQQIFDVVKDINKMGTTVLLVEQNARKALQIADYAYVMETGKIVMEGPAQEVAANPDVMAAYLGGKKKQ